MAYTAGSQRIEGDLVADEEDGRHVVRLACGHETLEVVPTDKTPTAVGESFSCCECGRSQRIVESFRVDP